MDPGQERATDEEAAQNPDDGQNRDSACKPIPEAPRKRREARKVTANQQVVAPGQCSAHEYGLGRLAAQIHHDGGDSGIDGHAGRPSGQVSGDARERRIGQQQNSFACDLQPNTSVDECPQPRGAVAVKYLYQPLSVSLQKLHPPVLNGDLPGVPKRGCEQDECCNSQGDVAEGEGKCR